MNTDQIDILIEIATDPAGALLDAPSELAESIQAQQDDITDKRRRAQLNEGLLRLRVR